MRSIKSPWQATFDEFVASIRESALIAAPYITRQPIERLADRLREYGSLGVQVPADALLQLDAMARRGRRGKAQSHMIGVAASGDLSVNREHSNRLASSGQV